ncbi:MAG: GNAT family N-acetyltransferase, partial [Aquificota bacterium]
MAETKRTDKRIKYKIEIKDYSQNYLKDVKEILDENFNNPWTEKQINFKDKFSYKKVYLIDDHVIAFLEAKVITDEAEIFMIAVKKNFQHKGIG